MRICLIGKNLTNYVLAKNLASKNLNVEIIHNNKNVKKFTNRTLAISRDNFDFLHKTNKKMNISSWPIKNIKIFSGQKKSKQLFEFKNKNIENFFLIQYNDILSFFENTCKKNKNIKVKYFKDSSKIECLYEKNNYNIIINSDSNLKLKSKYLKKKNREEL